MKNNNGFTLIELLLVIALMAISIGITSDILVTLVRSYNKSQVINEIEQSANFVAQKLTKELRNATLVITPSSSTPESNTLTFQTRDGDTISYIIENEKVKRRLGVGAVYSDLTSNTLPGGVKVSCSSNICFTLIQSDPQVIKITILMEQPGNPGSRVFTDSITINDTIVIRDTY